VTATVLRADADDAETAAVDFRGGETEGGRAAERAAVAVLSRRSACCCYRLGDAVERATSSAAPVVAADAGTKRLGVAAGVGRDIGTLR